VLIALGTTAAGGGPAAARPPLDYLLPPMWPPFGARPVAPTPPRAPAARRDHPLPSCVALTPGHTAIIMSCCSCCWRLFSRRSWLLCRTPEG